MRVVVVLFGKLLLSPCAQARCPAHAASIYHSCQPINTSSRQSKSKMDEIYNYETITYKTFSELLDSYKELVPNKLDDLEEQRLVIIPKSLSERTDDAYLKKPEVQKLVDWKLYVESVE